MATRLKRSASVQNAFDGNTVSPRVKHSVPELDVSLSGYKSVVAAFTGTSSNNVAISISGGTTISVNSVTQAHPITEANYCQ